MTILGTSIIIAAILVIISRKIIHSFAAFIVTFLLSSIYFIAFGNNPLFGYVYLLVYTAAISILFLFVIMMLDIPQSASLSSKSFILILIVGLGFYLGLDFDIWNSSAYHCYHVEWKIEYLDLMQVMAYYLYSEQTFLLLFIVYGLLLVMVSIILSLQNK